MSEKYFTKPDRPFLLIYTDTDDSISYAWLETEERLREVASELKGYGDKIIDAIEIGSCRTVDVPPDYLVDDFIEEINSAYETAKEQGFDSITLVIDTDMDMTYSINETENGFQCDEFDYIFDDLYSIASQLYDEMHGNVTDIRVE